MEKNHWIALGTAIAMAGFASLLRLFVGWQAAAIAILVGLIVVVRTVNRGKSTLLGTPVTEKDWRDIFRVNVDGVFFCCQAVLPRMMARRQGNIINIASWNGKLGAPNFGAYSATKFSVIGLTQALARAKKDQKTLFLWFSAPW